MTLQALLRHAARLLALPIALTATTAAMIPGHTARAAEFRERTIKFAHVQPKDSHMDAGAQKFAELVKAGSGGKLTIKVFPGGTLGGDLQTLAALQGGTVEMTTMPPGLMVGLNKEYAVFDLPFLFTSFKEADALLDGPVGRTLLEKTPSGVVGLAYWDHGFRNLTNSRRPVRTLEDFQGLKIRVTQSPMIIETINGLGANATPMSFTELYPALETRAVDGQENPSAVIVANKFFEVQKHIALTRHQYNPLIVLFSRKVWDQLNGDERALLTGAATEARLYQRQVSRDMDARAVAELQAKGMQVTEISDAERTRLQERLAPVSEKLARDIGEPLVRQVRAELERIRSGAGN